MSYDIRLTDPVTKEVLAIDAPHHICGGTFALGGTSALWLNVTYNYAKHFYRVFGEKGVRTIYGMTGEASTPVLAEAIAALGDDVADNYWAPTEGNAKKALEGLLYFARLRPDGVWDGD